MRYLNILLYTFIICFAFVMLIYIFINGFDMLSMNLLIQLMELIIDMFKIQNYNE